MTWTEPMSSDRIKESIVSNHMDKTDEDISKELKAFNVNEVLTNLTIDTWKSGTLVNLKKLYYVNEMVKNLNGNNFSFVEEMRSALFSVDKNKILEMFYKYSRG